MSLRAVGATFITPGSGSGSGSGSSSTTNISNAPILVFSIDPDQGDSGDRGPIGLTGETGAPGSSGGGGGVPFFAEQYIEESSFVPGPAGGTGSQGTQGIQGLPGNITFILPEDSEDSNPIPGPRGTDGIIGSNGATGPPGVPFLVLPDDPEEGMLGPTGPRGATGAAGGGGGSATTVEVDLGATLKWSGTFTITDAAITSTSKVLCWQAPGPYTGKGTRADEAQMQPVQVIATFPATGSALVYWQTPPMITQKKLPSAGGQPASAIIPGLKDPQSVSRSEATRIGKVRGNVKFSYLVFS